MPTRLATGSVGGVVNRRWRLDRLLGEGAEAQVFLATDLASGALRALKALSDGDAGAEARLRWEFAAIGGIDHPSLVRVHDLARARPPGPLAEGQLFFTADHVDGLPPAAALRGLPAAEHARRLIDLIAQVAAALDALHGRGLVHHDVKPANLLIQPDGRVRLLDLGLAAARGSGGTRGTLAYLAPEALLGGGDARVDLYALGATVHELWSGRPPFDGTVAEVVAAALTAQTPSLQDRTGAPPPPGLARIVGRLLARDPARRHPSARALLEDALRAGATLDGDALPRQSVAVLGRPSLVGRRAALSSLAEQLDPLFAGRRPAGVAYRVIAVVGPPGSGRSRLVEEAVRAAQLGAVGEGAAGVAVHGPDP
ncbi:MAG: hypothetical protein EXR72_23615, partial [Myxococcales bacterium]|nr:hypothetical protein [Myxococcales bacterium]